MIHRIERSKMPFRSPLSTGFTLIEVMVLVSALTLLAVVVSAPITHTSDLRRAALTISRVHDIVVTTELYRTYVGKWPKKNRRCVFLGVNEANQPLYNGYKVAPITGWGGGISVSCNNKHDPYEITYSVPKDWAGMFISHLEYTRQQSVDDDLAVLITKIEVREGGLNDSISFSFDELFFGEADVDGYCDEGEEKNVFYAPDAVCYSVSTGKHMQAIRSEYDSAFDVVKMSRSLYIPPVGGEVAASPSPTQNARAVCAGAGGWQEDVLVKALVQCKPIEGP